MFLTSAFVPSFRTRQKAVELGVDAVEILPPDPHRVTIVFSTDSNSNFCLDIDQMVESGRVCIHLWGPGDRVVDWSTYGVLTTLRWHGRATRSGSILNLTEILFEPSGA